jgi:hypothetical protein
MIFSYKITEADFVAAQKLRSRKTRSSSKPKSFILWPILRFRRRFLGNGEPRTASPVRRLPKHAYRRLRRWLLGLVCSCNRLQAQRNELHSILSFALAKKQRHRDSGGLEQPRLNFRVYANAAAGSEDRPTEDSHGGF